MEEKTNKKLEEINKCLKENKEKAIKRVKERIQDLNTEIKAIKKTQTEGIKNRNHKKIIRNHKCDHEYKRWKTEFQVLKTQ